MIDNPVHGGIIGDESDDLHHSPALRAKHRVDFINLANHLRPALGRDALLFLLSHPQNQRRDARLPHFPPVGVGVEAVITDSDLAFVGDMRGHPGDELQIIHRLLLGAVLVITIADLPLRFQERQPLQREHRSDHVLSHPLGLRLGLGPHSAVD